MKKAVSIIILLFNLIVIFPSNVLAATWDKDLDPVFRVAGSSRYDTNYQGSYKWMGIGKSEGERLKENVVLVNGESYPDAIVSISLAHSGDPSNYGSSVLLQDPLSNTLTAKSEIVRLLDPYGPRKVYLIGGISDILSNEIRNMGYIPEKIAGSDRYETSYLVSKKIFQNLASKGVGASDTVIVVNGENFADAIGILGWAGYNNVPILLTPQSSLSYWAEKTILENSSIRKAIILGGPAIVSSSVEDRLWSLGLQEVKRFAGADRYETNNLFNNVKFTAYDNRVMFASTGEDFVDAISAGFAAAKFNRPILLTPNTYLPTVQSNFINNQSKQTDQIQNIYLIGGVVSPETKNSIFLAGWWWAPWATLYVQDIDPTKKIQITSYMDFYNYIPSDLGNGTNDVDYENNLFLPNDQNLYVWDHYTNLPWGFYNYVFIDVAHDGDEHDWTTGTDVPEQLQTNQSYYVQYIVTRQNIYNTIPYASNLKIYGESQLKIYGGYPDSSLDLIDKRPAFEVTDIKNLP